MKHQEEKFISLYMQKNLPTRMFSGLHGRKKNEKKEMVKCLHKRFPFSHHFCLTVRFGKLQYVPESSAGHQKWVLLCGTVFGGLIYSVASLKNIYIELDANAFSFQARSFEMWLEYLYSILFSSM